MELSLMIGLGIVLIVGIAISIMVDVDTFAGGFFSKFTKGKDPHREG